MNNHWSWVSFKSTDQLISLLKNNLNEIFGMRDYVLVHYWEENRKKYTFQIVLFTNQVYWRTSFA